MHGPQGTCLGGGTERCPPPTPGPRNGQKMKCAGTAKGRSQAHQSAIKMVCTKFRAGKSDIRLGLARSDAFHNPSRPRTAKKNCAGTTKRRSQEHQSAVKIMWSKFRAGKLDVCKGLAWSDAIHRPPRPPDVPKTKGWHGAMPSTNPRALGWAKNEVLGNGKRKVPSTSGRHKNGVHKTSCGKIRRLLGVGMERCPPPPLRALDGQK
ncbi:hypothetical protein JCGZ_21751 [Jatropha curcas]|uniref:Uncharacterized protein n=1 Tax=Jatropha curcas TaxID=180498 RepID=A0A067JMQ2_JATCU|nr:hypothetical protein JCGZ_21751 [Jatropha curcas]